MKDAPHYLKDMARIVEPAPPAEQATRRRTTLILGIDRSARRVEMIVKARQRRRVWLSVGLTAAAVVGAILVGGGGADWAKVGVSDAGRSAVAAPRAPAERSASISESARTASGDTLGQSLVRGRIVSEEAGKIAPGHELGHGLLTVGTEQPALIHLASGAQMEADAGSKLRLSANRPGDVLKEAVLLGLGGVELEVPPLGKDRRLLVETEEAVVEVRGTAFRVERTKSEHSPDLVTRVTVSEGLVSVRSGGSEVFLRPGDRWESGVVAKQDGGSKSLSERTHEPDLVRPAETPEARPANGTLPSASDLAQQNELYHSALLASRNGFVDLARARFEQLLRQHPDSPLAPGARRELERLGSGAASAP